MGKRILWVVLLFGLSVSSAFAGEADIIIPPLETVVFNVFGKTISGYSILYGGILICALGAAFGLIQYKQTKNLPVHESMRLVSNTIWETCKTYLAQQGKFLVILWVLIGACMVYYFGFLSAHPPGTPVARNIVIILLASILGILGSYGVAWFGIRINTVANSRTAFSALKSDSLATLLSRCAPA